MNKTTEALELAEALENDAKEHREVSYGLDCPPERTANWKHALNCEAAARLIREALAEPVKQEPVAVISESAIGLVKLHSNGACLPFGTKLYAAPVSAPKQKPVAFYIYKPTPARFDQFKGGVLDGSLPWVYDQDPSSGFVASMLVAPCDAPVDAKAILETERKRHAFELSMQEELFADKAEAIRAEALEEAAKVCRTAQAKGLQSIREAIEAAIRGLK